MALYGSGRPADWGLNRPGGMVNKLNRNPRRGEWSNSSRWEEKCLSGFREPSQELCRGHWP